MMIDDGVVMMIDDGMVMMIDDGARLPCLPVRPSVRPSAQHAARRVGPN